MRVSQLARILSKTPSDIIQFFEKRGLVQYDSANSKISNEHVVLLYKKFRPDLMDTYTHKIADDEIESGNVDSSSSIASNQDDQKSKGYKTNDLEYPKNKTESSSPLQEEKNSEGEDVEIIRAPKIKLEGVKIIGKIELPESPKPRKEEESIEKKIAKKVLYSAENKRQFSNQKQGKNKYYGKNAKSSVKTDLKKELSYEDKLKLEEERRKKELIKQKEIQKERKKMHYVQHVQSKIQPPKKGTNKRDNDVKLKPERPVYKSPFRKFLAWLNNEYDKYD